MNYSEFVGINNLPLYVHNTLNVSLPGTDRNDKMSRLKFEFRLFRPSVTNPNKKLI